MAIYVYLNSYLYWCFLFLPFDSSYCPVILFFFFFQSERHSSEQVCWKMFLKTSQLCLMWDCLNFFMLEGQFYWIQNSWFRIFLQHFEYVILLSSMVSDDKSAGNYFEDPLYMMSYFPQVFQISLFVFVFQKFDCDVPRCGYLSLSCLELARILGCIYSLFFLRAQNFCPLFLQILFSPFSDFLLTLWFMLCIHHCIL